MALVRTLRERDIVKVGDVTFSIAYIRGTVVRVAIQAPPELRIECGQLEGVHHGHGGERLDENGKPRWHR